MNSCPVITDQGVVRAVLASVDCNTRGFARMGYEALTASGSPFQTALTLLLTIYVAVIGYRLLFGTGARLSDGPGIALKIGAVLALLASWSLFQTLVFDTVAQAPVQLAAAISAPLRAGESLARDPVEGLQSAHDRLTEAAAFFARPADQAANLDKDLDKDADKAAQLLSLAATALLVGSAGLIALITVAIGVLTAIGPLFIALFIFLETRGFFAGWVRALTAAALALLCTWTLSILMLDAITPWLAALEEPAPLAQSGITAAMIVLVFAFGQIALVLAAIMIARGFRLSGPVRRMPAATTDRTVRPSVTQETPLRPALLSEQLARSELPTAWVGRATLAAASVAGGARREPAMGVATAATARIGDLYRRPAVGKREGRR